MKKMTEEEKEEMKRRIAIVKEVIERDEKEKEEAKKRKGKAPALSNSLLGITPVGLLVIMTGLLFPLLFQGLLPAIFAILFWLAFAIAVFAFCITEVEPKEVMALKNLCGELRFLKAGFHFFPAGWEKEFKRISLKDEVRDPAQITVITKDAMDITVDYKVTQRVAKGEENYRKVCTVIDYEKRNEVVDINLQAAVRDEFAKYTLDEIVYQESSEKESGGKQTRSPEKTQEEIENNINERLKKLIEEPYGMECEMALLSITHGSEEAAEKIFRAEREAQAAVIRAKGEAAAITERSKGITRATKKIKGVGVSPTVAAFLASNTLESSLLAALSLAGQAFRSSAPRKRKRKGSQDEEETEDLLADEGDEENKNKGEEEEEKK